MGCEVFFKQVKKHFGFLIREYEFHIEYKEEGKSFDNCMIILKSDKCCVRIVRDRGDALVEIGPSALKNYYGGEEEGWFYLSTIISFIEKDLKEDIYHFKTVRKFKKDDDRTNFQLSRDAKKMKRYIEVIFNLFNENTFTKIEPELKVFSKKRMELILEKL